jgi:hypothetical protein
MEAEAKSLHLNPITLRADERQCAERPSGAIEKLLATGLEFGL